MSHEIRSPLTSIMGLDLSKIEAGKLVPNVEAVSPHAVLGEVQGLMDVRAREKHLPLILRYDGALPESILEKRGHEIRSAFDGESAIATARDFRPDVIFLDIRLPDIDGYDQMLRAQEEW
jgi:signal transduction histidine kinase